MELASSGGQLLELPLLRWTGILIIKMNNMAAIHCRSGRCQNPEGTPYFRPWCWNAKFPWMEIIQAVTIEG